MNPDVIPLSQMKFRLRTLLVVIATVSVLLAVPTFIHTTVIPANRLTNQRLIQIIGTRFEQNGVLPKSPYIRLEDYPDLVDLQLEQDETGSLYNRWGEQIKVLPVGVGQFEDEKVMELSIYSSGPYGLGSNSLHSSFKHEAE